MEHLYEKLFCYAEGGIYPYHMPGHKRNAWGMLPEAFYKTDITEIEGFDNLHQPENILARLQREAALLYGAEESYYLVNGSTCGILSAVSSAVPFGGYILMARNCHKSAYHAVYLRHLKVSYLYPEYLGEYGIFEAVTARQIQKALEQNPAIGAVLIVSPTYEGRIADISEIAGIVHEKGIPLIVDEAHGAHLGLAEGFSGNSCQAGADIVIHSVHKTLPALTQAALLHVNGKLIDRDRLRRFLHIYQTSSPSYPLMASIDNALQYIRINGKTAFGRFRKLYGEMMERLGKCRYLKFLTGDFREQDVGKLVISVNRVGLTGKALYDILLQEYHLQTEMAAETFVLAMFTINDGEEAYARMTEALLDVDHRLIAGRLGFGSGWEEKENQAYSVLDFCGAGNSVSLQTDRGIPLAEAWEMASEPVALKESVGRLAAEFIQLYPPGVPLLVPGEQMTGELCRKIMQDLEAGLTVQGVSVETGGGDRQKMPYVRVICENCS